VYVRNEPKHEINHSELVLPPETAVTYCMTECIGPIHSQCLQPSMVPMFRMNNFTDNSEPQLPCRFRHPATADNHSCFQDYPVITYNFLTPSVHLLAVTGLRSSSVMCNNFFGTNPAATSLG